MDLRVGLNTWTLSVTVIFKAAEAEVYQPPSLSWKSYIKGQRFLARQLMIITNPCETLKFIVSNSSWDGEKI